MLTKRMIAKALRDNPPPPIKVNITGGTGMTEQKQVNMIDPIQYQIAETVAVEMTPPENATNLLFEVDRYAGGGHKPLTIEGVAASTYASIAKTLNGVKHLDEAPEKWSGANPLMVYPFAGQGLNAYYNRKHLAFFYDKNRETNEWFFTSASPDIVVHELGHALLDAWRPDLWNAASLEIWAFHEAFSDIVSMLSLMQYHETIMAIIEETGGDLRKNNMASDLAENFSEILIANGYDSAEGYLRSGINDYKYNDPQFLPKTGDHTVLSRQPHSFSRVFFGAAYDLLVLFFEHYKNEVDEVHALAKARDTLAVYLIKAVKNAPASVRFFESVAKTMLWADHTNGGVFHDRMLRVFSNRKIIGYQFHALSAKDRLGSLNGHVRDHGEGMKTICRSQEDTLSNCSNHLRIQGVDEDDLYNVKLSILETDAYMHDEEGRLLHTHQVPHGEAVQAAEEMVAYLKSTNGVSDDPDTPFEIRDGKLKRTLICCCSGGRKPLPSSPEYNKPYKHENNAGCCGGCKHTDKKVRKRKVKRGCYVRYSVNQ